MPASTESFVPAFLLAASAGFWQKLGHLPRSRRPFQAVQHVLRQLKFVFQDPLGTLPGTPANFPLVNQEAAYKALRSLIHTVMHIVRPPMLLKGEIPVGKDPSMGKISHETICPQCRSVCVPSVESFSVLNLQPGTEQSLMDLIHRRFRNKTNIVATRCCECGQDDGLLAYSKISKAPAVLVVHLDRATCNRGPAIEIPTDMPLSYEYEGYAVSEEYASYALRAVINRQDCSTGETKFTASLRLPGKLSTSKKKKWFHVDNVNIARVEFEQAICPRTANIVIYERIF